MRLEVALRALNEIERNMGVNENTRELRSQIESQLDFKIGRPQFISDGPIMLTDKGVIGEVIQFQGRVFFAVIPSAGPVMARMEMGDEFTYTDLSGVSHTFTIRTLVAAFPEEWTATLSRYGFSQF